MSHGQVEKGPPDPRSEPNADAFGSASTLEGALRPKATYVQLIRSAILKAENQSLTLQQIYDSIEADHPYFRSAKPGWKNTVRHSLSMNPCFVHTPRPFPLPGKGGYWSVDIDAPEVHIRKRIKTPSTSSSSSKKRERPSPQSSASDGEQTTIASTSKRRSEAAAARPRRAQSEPHESRGSSDDGIGESDDEQPASPSYSPSGSHRSLLHHPPSAARPNNQDLGGGGGGGGGGGHDRRSPFPPLHPGPDFGVQHPHQPFPPPLNFPDPPYSNSTYAHTSTASEPRSTFRGPSQEPFAPPFPRLFLPSLPPPSSQGSSHSHLQAQPSSPFNRPYASRVPPSLNQQTSHSHYLYPSSSSFGPGSTFTSDGPIRPLEVPAHPHPNRQHPHPPSELNSSISSQVLGDSDSSQQTMTTLPSWYSYRSGFGSSSQPVFTPPSSIHNERQNSAPGSTSQSRPVSPPQQKRQQQPFPAFGAFQQHMGPSEYSIGGGSEASGSRDAAGTVGGNASSSSESQGRAKSNREASVKAWVVDQQEVVDGRQGPSEKAQEAAQQRKQLAPSFSSGEGD